MAARMESGPAASGRRWAAALIGVGLLLFCWPFVRTPPLGLLAAYVHLLTAWAAVIAGIALTARAVRPGRRTDA